MRILLACAILVASAFSSLQADIVLFEDFEDNTVNYTVDRSEFHDGVSDYFTITPLNSAANPVSPYTGFGGSNYFAAEDIDDGNTRPSTGTLSFNVGIAGFTDLNLDLLFAAGGNGAGVPSYDSNDGFLVTAQIDGGSIQNLLAFDAVGTTNQLLRQDTDFDGTGDGFLPSSAFTAFNGLAIAGTGSNLVVEIFIASNDGNTEFAFDNVTINGTSAVPEPSSLMVIGMFSMAGLLRRCR